MNSDRIPRSIASRVALGCYVSGLSLATLILLLTGVPSGRGWVWLAAIVFGIASGVIARAALALDDDEGDQL